MYTRPKTMFPWTPASNEWLKSAFERHVSAATFPCVGAKAALAKGTLEILSARDIASAWDDLRIHERLRHFAQEYRDEPQLFRSLAVIFEVPSQLTELQFEKLLWTRVQSLSDKDVWLGQEYDASVSSDPGNPHFSLSFGGEAFFVVGLHPNASRPARQFPYPVMVFNLHDQFEMLRERGKYEGMREKIMMRDEALAGSRNPMLARHGESSEARQYSGRAVHSDWKCPFQYKGHE